MIMGNWCYIRPLYSSIPSYNRFSIFTPSLFSFSCWTFLIAVDVVSLILQYISHTSRIHVTLHEYSAKSSSVSPKFTFLARLLDHIMECIDSRTFHPKEDVQCVYGIEKPHFAGKQHQVGVAALLNESSCPRTINSPLIQFLNSK